MSPTSPTSTTTLNNREHTLSVLYAPHGLPYPVVKAWAQTHLIREAGLPLTALLHNFDEVDNPWYLGGTIAHGLRGGSEIAKYLMPKVWVGAHDEEKELSGIGIKLMKTRKIGVQEVKAKLSDDGVNVENLTMRGGDITEQRASFTSSSDSDSRSTEEQDLKSPGSRSKNMKVVVLGVGEELRVEG